MFGFVSLILIILPQIFVILSSVGAVLVLFAAPETKFDRPAFAIDGKPAKVDAFGNLVMLSESEASEVALHDGGLDDHDGPADSMTYPESLTRLAPFKIGDFKLILTVYKYMGLALLDPAILWALGASSIVLGITIGQSLTFGTILQTKYMWAHQHTGLIYLGSIPLSALMYLTTGWGGDKINLALARRNHGVHLPEHRVSAMVTRCRREHMLNVSLSSIAPCHDCAWYSGDCVCLDVRFLRGCCTQGPLVRHRLQHEHVDISLHLDSGCDYHLVRFPLRAPCPHAPQLIKMHFPAVWNR